MYGQIAALQKRILLRQEILTQKLSEAADTGAPVVSNSQESVDEEETGSGQFVPSVDYRSVCLRGETISLTYQQSVIVRLLHEQYLQGTPDVGFQSLAEEAAGSTEFSHKSLRDIFRNKEAREKLIRPGERKGTYRLNI
jgi:hypothetical protein